MPDAVLRAVLEISDDAIVLCDAAGRITSWGTTAERLSGCREADALGGHLEDLFPPHLREEVRAVVTRALVGERIQHFETEMVRADGMPIALWLSLCPVFDADGAPRDVVVIARDVTEQHLAQGTLAEMEARLQEGEALAHVGSWLWDLRTGAVQWSREFHRIHGVDPLDFDGTFESHLAVIHADDRGSARTAMEGSIASGRPFSHEYRIIRPDQQVRILRVRAQPSLGSAGTSVGLRGIGQDVTEGSAPLASRGRPDA